MGLGDWANAVLQVTHLYVTIVPFDGDWQSWGLQFSDSPTLGSLNPPGPYDYTDWRDWGRKLAESLGNATGAAGPGVG